VTKGLFSVLLGDTAMGNMTAVDPAVFANSDVRLRVWFNDGTNGFQLLTPDQRLASAGYSITSASATTAASAAALNKYSSAPFSASAANAGAMYFNTTDQRVYYSDGTIWQALGNYVAPGYRWALWHTYDQGGGWFFNNDPSLAAGVAPSTWSDSNGKASQISADKQMQAALFNKRAVLAANSIVWAETYQQYSSTDAKIVGALFRIRNKTGSAVSWSLYFHATCYGAWGEYASIALNGVDAYVNSGSSYAYQSYSATLSIPANRTSTVICVAGSSPFTSAGSTGSRSAVLAFRNNCLVLPAGLEFVDDLDTATGGYEQ
jgi:hypothetical protein